MELQCAVVTTHIRQWPATAPFYSLASSPRARDDAPLSTDTLTRLSAALADHYRFERALGAGGLATVMP